MCIEKKNRLKGTQRVPKFIAKEGYIERNPAGSNVYRKEEYIERNPAGSKVYNKRRIY